MLKFYDIWWETDMLSFYIFNSVAINCWEILISDNKSEYKRFEFSIIKGMLHPWHICFKTFNLKMLHKLKKDLQQ